MRVLQAVPSLAPQDGGPSAVARGLSDALAAKGLSVDLATTVDPGEADWPTAVPCHRFVRWSNGSFKYSPGFGRWVRENCRSFDLLHVHAVFSYPSMAAAAAAARIGIPYIWRSAGSLSRWSLQQRSWKKRLALKAGLETLIRRATLIHCTSAAEAREVEEQFPGVATVAVPNGVGERLFAASREESKTIVFVGRLHPKKRVDLLIRSFHASAASRNGWSLVLAGHGDPDHVRHLREVASEGSGQVRFAGWVDGDERIDLLRKAALFVLPSRDENFALAAAEALACGVPVIVTRNVAIVDDVIAYGAGWSVEPDEEAIAARIDQACADGEERQARSMAARRLAQDRYRWERVAEAVCALYEQILSRKSVPSN